MILNRTPVAFIMIPFSGTKQVRDAIELACRKSGYICEIVDDLSVIGRISLEIERKIKSADVCICDATGKNPNVAWECGYAIALEKNVILITQSKEDLYHDILDFSAIVYKLTSIENSLVKPLVDKLNLQRPNRFLPHQLAQTKINSSLSTVACSVNIQQTPYSIFNLFELATDKIFIAGQNLGFVSQSLTNRIKFKETVYKFLEKLPTSQVEIMICDENCKHAVETWEYVLETTHYKRHLLDSIEYFQEIVNEFKNESDYFERFIVRKFDFVPLSISFIDPENEITGLAIVTPNAFQKSNISKPSFILSNASNKEVLKAYWNTFYHYFNAMPHNQLS